MEQRGCWQQRVPGAEAAAAAPTAPQRRGDSGAPASQDADRVAHVLLEFIPVELVSRAELRDQAPAEAPAEVPPEAQRLPIPPEPEPGWSERTSLFGEQEA